MATTINAYSVGLQLDARNYIRNSRLSRGETGALTRSINQARSPADKYARQVRLLDKALASGAITQRTYNKLLADANTRFKRAGSSAKGYSNSFAGLATNIKAGAAALGTFLAAGQIHGGISDAINAESMGLQFEVLTRNAETAANLTQRLRAFSARTPFQFNDIAQAGRQLLAFGFTADQVVENVRVLGNLAAGTGNNISELAEIIGKARVQGRLFNEDINQLTGRGINVIDGLAASFGDVKKAAADGRIQFSDLQEVLKGLTTDGGQFSGMMERMSETTAGKISTLTDNFKALRMELSKEVVPALSSTVDWMTKTIKKANVGIDLLFRGGKNTFADLEAKQREQQEQMRFAVTQVMNKHSIRAQQGLSGFGSTAAGTASGVGGGLFGGLQGAARQLSLAARSQLNVHQNQIAAIQRQERLEREKATKPSPAIRSLEVGTQEAYKFLTQQQEDAKTIAKKEAKRQEAADTKFTEQNNAIIDALNRVETAIDENGFTRWR